MKTMGRLALSCVLLLLVTVPVLTLVSGTMMRKESQWECSWERYTQPLSHFTSASEIDQISFQQRVYVCMPKKWMDADHWEERGKRRGAVFFYCGNESPVELYINHTGFMFEFDDLDDFGQPHHLRASVETLDRVLVFAEHRFFGQSRPEEDKLPASKLYPYLGSKEALADYVSVIKAFRRRHHYLGLLDEARWPLIAFGGSYGGMLAAWIRYKYPSVVQGAVAASAPILGFELHSAASSSRHTALDAASQMISESVEGYDHNARPNLLAAWNIIHVLSTSRAGRDFLFDKFTLCSPLTSPSDARLLLSQLQSVFFFFAEGNFNFETDYIVYSALNTTAKLPRRPLSVAADLVKKDYGIKVVGDVSSVDYAVHVDCGEHKVLLQVDWANVNMRSEDRESDMPRLVRSEAVNRLLEDVSRVYQLFYNVSETLRCISWDPSLRKTINAAGPSSSQVTAVDLWNIIACNEGINFTPLLVQGVGNDLMWPPNVKKASYSRQAMIEHGLDFCGSINVGGYAYDKRELDATSRFLEAYYGGLGLLQTSSRIIFTNGGFDPWHTCGVSADDISTYAQDSTLKAVFMETGAHHSELFFAHPGDNLEIRSARIDMKRELLSWISDLHSRSRDQRVISH